MERGVARVWYGAPPRRRRHDGDPVTILVTPRAMLAPTTPAVGIFWRVNGVLVLDRSTLDEGEPYGDCITHGAGHYERWREWQAMGIARLGAIGYPNLILSSEYDQWPRGRIVYETLAQLLCSMLTGACRSLPSSTPSRRPSV
jgi:hypothetical protein